MPLMYPIALYGFLLPHRLWAERLYEAIMLVHRS
jgi:hypothetical protein